MCICTKQVNRNCLGLGCVYGVELCTKLQHSVSRKCVRKIVLYHVWFSTIKIDISGDPKYSVNGSNNVYCCFPRISPWHLPFSNVICNYLLLEHIVCSNIMAHLDEHKLLSDKQHAFRKWHSCETQLATMINDWAKILDNQGQVDTFILDFEKAFDTPPHELLKSKLFSYGIGGKTLKWINAFLCYRQQRVVVNGVKSDWAPVVSGVPQGTVLGPLLFSLHINDITADIESEIRLFADDCVCYREIKDKEDTLKLQRDIDRLGNWARKWGMRFQPVKCNMMQLTNKTLNKIQASYTLEGTVLENVDNIKYLGVTITNDLKWNTHISNICTKANRTLGS